MSSPTDFHKDPEAAETTAASLFENDLVRSFAWSDVSVTVKDRTTKQPLAVLESCSGLAQAGEVVALMGPSGSGKTTLLNVLANRSKSRWEGRVLVNGSTVDTSKMREISGYVEQDDALIGSLTVKETIDFSSRLAVAGMSKTARRKLVDSLIRAFGLQQQENTIIGTPLRKGISGGQKRRVSVAAQLVASPKILFLDEPTSGLDSAASYEVMSFISSVAKKHSLIVIASIHQPSTTTFDLFDTLLLLSKGKTCYFGPIQDLSSHFEPIAPLPLHMNPAEFLLDLINVDFLKNGNDNDDSLHYHMANGKSPRPPLTAITQHWTDSEANTRLKHHTTPSTSEIVLSFSSSTTRKPLTSSLLSTPLTLLHRNFIKSHRDFLAYGTRVAMYAGLAVMMGTVWLRLPYTQASIQPFANAIFFSAAFISFMAVAYVPSVIEDLLTFRKEHANGLCGPAAFTCANFLVGVPWLAFVALLFSVVTYWLSNFRDDDAGGFWTWVLWLFLDLLAAEGLVVLLSSVFPVFVVALAATAFANGLWMSVGGFLVPLGTLNVFWKYVFHYIDYQAYVFQAMMVNQFKRTTYRCETLDDGASYYCMYPSARQGEGVIEGTAVLDAYKYSYADGKMWEWFGIMVAIVVVYRLLGYGVLVLRTRAW